MVCKFCGASDIEVTPREITCKRCHMVYENSGKPPKDKKSRRRQNQPQNSQTVRQDGTNLPQIAKHEDAKKNGPQYIRIHDVLRTVDESGEEQIEIVQDIDFRVAGEKYVPDLKIDAAKAEFFRWLFRDTVKKEKRYGRDWLRRNGYVPVERVEDRGKVVTLYAREGGEEKAKLTYELNRRD